ncbi:ABC transporter substrate-binding protein [Pseudanabaena biceps]|nr:ABC transporter substrate-binding protein [Pseudanabaena biceps]
MLRRILLVLVTFVLIIIFSACTQLQEPKTLRVGLNDWLGYAIAIYAKEAKLFEKHGIKVDLVEFSNQQDNIRATIRGSQDMSFVTLWEVMQVDPSNDRPVVILVSDISHGSDGIVTRKGINSLEDLKGKKVGAKLGTVAHLILLEALKSAQLKPEDIEIVSVSNEKGAELLKSQAIDAAVMWQPLLSKTQVATDGKIIFTTEDVDSLVLDTLVTGAKNLALNKKNLAKFIAAWFDAIQDVEATPDKVFNIIATQIGETKESVSNGYKGIIKGNIALNKRMFAMDGRLKQSIQEIKMLLQEDLRHSKIIRDDVDVNAEPLMMALEGLRP